MSIGRMFFFSYAIVSCGACTLFPSFEDINRSWIGTQISEYEKYYGSPREIHKLPGGNQEYEFHFKELDPTCIEYWIVDDHGTMISSRHSGRCSPI